MTQLTITDKLRNLNHDIVRVSDGQSDSDLDSIRNSCLFLLQFTTILLQCCNFLHPRVRWINKILCSSVCAIKVRRKTVKIWQNSIWWYVSISSPQRFHFFRVNQLGLLCFALILNCGTSCHPTFILLSRSHAFHFLRRPRLLNKGKNPDSQRADKVNLN